MIRLSIPGKPIAKKRPRFAKRGKFVTTYSDQVTEEGKTYIVIKEQIDSLKDYFVFDDAVYVRIYFYMPRIKGHYGTGKNAGYLKKSAPAYHTKKPDIDNLVKFYFDILNDLVWSDDSIVTGVAAIKEYCKPNDARTEIFIEDCI